MPIKKGDTVIVEYEGTLDDGTVFDSSERHHEPLKFEVGAGTIIKGFDDALIGMEKGDEKTITLQPADAYGERDPQLLKVVPRSQLPEGEEPKEGMMLLMGLPNGAKIPVKIVEVGDDTVTLDLNHPLAGNVLHFKIKVVDVIAS